MSNHRTGNEIKHLCGGSLWNKGQDRKTGFKE